MPLAHIHVPEVLPADKIRRLADAVHDGLVSTCNVPFNDRFQLIFQLDGERMIIDRHFPDVSRTPEASIVQILFLRGRTVEQKKALFQHIAAGAVEAGFSGDDIMVCLVENAALDWSLGRGQCFADRLGEE